MIMTDLNIQYKHTYTGKYCRYKYYSTDQTCNDSLLSTWISAL